MTTRLISQVHFTDVVEVVLPAHLSVLEPVLLRFRAFCDFEGIDQDQRSGLELLLRETFKNAIQHGSPRGQESRIQLSWRLADHILEFRMTDEGGFLPDPELPVKHGVGTNTLLRIADSHEHTLARGRHRLTYRKYLAPMTDRESAIRLERELVIDAMARELSDSYESVVTLLRLGQTLAETVTLYDFLRVAMSRLRRVLVANCVNVRLVNEWQGVLRMAYCDLDMDLDIAFPEYLLLQQESLEVRSFQNREEIHLDHSRDLPFDEPLRAFGGPVFIAPVCYQERILGTITLAGQPNQRFWSAGQLNLLRQVADFIGIASVNAQLHEAREQQMKTGRELEIAREIQNSLFPRKMPVHPGFAVHGSCRAAHIVGGDFFDVLELEDAEGVLVAIADVIGRGVPAALLATIFRTALHALRDLGAQPHVLLMELNRQLVEDLGTLDVFVTAQVGFYSIKKQTLTLSTAGHCPLMHFRGDHPEPEFHSVEGFPLGLVQEAQYTDKEIQLAPGDRLVFLTDGMYEISDSNGDPLGLPELTHRLHQFAPMEPLEVCSAILASVEEFAVGSKLADDRTLMVFDCLG